MTEEKTAYRKELMVAKNAALQAWQLIAPLYDKPIEVETKLDGTPVTIADKTANEFIIESLKEAFPNDTLVSEEAETVFNPDSGMRNWYIDPIDGTKGFIKRNGHFAIHIGFCHGIHPTLGVVYWPVTGDMYYGIVGCGAFRENSRGILELKVEPSQRKNLIASTNGDFPARGLEELFSALNVGEFWNSGSEGLRLMKIAENRADIRISEKADGAKTWDVCAPHAVFEAAGGFLRWTSGHLIEYRCQSVVGRYLAANSKELMDKALEKYTGLIGEKTICEALAVEY